MDFTKDDHGNRMEIALRGQFTFFDTTMFTKIRDLFAQPGMEEIVLKFNEVDFIDSAALGMLLLAREEATARSVRLVLAKPSRAVEKAFKVSAFETLFTIEA